MRASPLSANAVNATPGAGVNDLAFSDGSRFLYVVNGGSHAINGYVTGADGGLQSIGSFAGLPVGASANVGPATCRMTRKGRP